MTNFFLNNANKIDLLRLKEGNTIKSNDKFLKKYDANNNSVWDAEEMNQFMSDLNDADINGDGKIDREESINWYSRITNFSTENVRTLFQKKDDNEVYKSLGNIMRENAEQDAIAQISKNAKEGLDIYNVARGGAISKGCNSIKELFNTEYAGDKVYRQLINQQVSALLLKKAKSKEGLTKKEYIESKNQLLELLLGKDKLPANEQKLLQDAILDTNEDTLDSLITHLVNAENEDFSELQHKVLTQFKNNMQEKSSKDIGFNTIHNGVGSLSDIIERSGYNILTFDKIFELEMGVPFNANNSIDRYEKQYELTTSIISSYNKVCEINEDLSKNISAMDGYNKHGNTTGLENEQGTLYKNLSNSILAALQKYYGKDTEKIQEVLAKYNAKLENNEVTFDYAAGKNYAIVDLAKNLLSDIQSNLETVMDGKTIEDYSNELKEAYKAAYGGKNSVDLAAKFQESQQEGVVYTKMGVSTAGVALAVLSNGTLLPVTGMLMGAFGSGIVGGIESVTKEGGMTCEDAKELAKELATSGILTLAGMKEGEIAAQIGKTLLKSCPKFMQYIGEYGSMAVMGALTDYAVMGEINLTQESISNLINIATGIVAHRKIAKAQKNHPSKQPQTETEVPVNDEVSTMNNLMKKVRESDDIQATKNQIMNSSEFNTLPPEHQTQLLKTIDDFANIKNISGLNLDDANILLQIKIKRNLSDENIKYLSDVLKKYSQYKTEILDIVNSNNNIKFGETLDGNTIKHIDNIVELIEANPHSKDDIVNYIKIQRRAKNDTSDPIAGISKYIETLNKYPEHQDFIKELSMNGNLDAKSTDGGINTIEAALNLHIKDGFSKDDILILSHQNYTVPYIRKQLYAIKKQPELRNSILNEIPEYTFIDNNPTLTPRNIIENRFKIKENLEKNFPNEMKKLKQTLGDEFFFKIKWEDIIPENATQSEIKSILDNINESSKFFARLSVNEQQYGKNIQWASKMNDMSNGASFLISQGKDFDSVLSYIAGEYHAYDEATTLATNHSMLKDRRLASGKYRGDNTPEEYYTTYFDNIDDYSEYFDRFASQNGVRKAPYDDIELTQILYNKHVGDGSSGTMYHPANKYVEPGLNHVKDRYNELQPLFEKVKNGQKLSSKEIEFANDKISEIYFLMANVMPYERGSNGISDILMRSIYKSLGIEQPALKQGVSLDLEAFCMDLNEYKKKWNSFFESK